MKEHYLDNAATTKPCAAAVQAMLRCFQETYGNPSSLHRVGLRAQQEMDSARKLLAAALGCDVREILFTSCATESTNAALRSIAAAYGRRRRKIVTSAVEHASVRQTLGFLSENEGFEIVEIVPDENGRYHARDFIQAVDENTCLITMMMVNNETGYVLPVKEVFSAVKRRFPQIITHCDAVQAFMKYLVRPMQLQADFISLSGHKVHAAKSVGALYVKRGMKLRPLLLGGKQENSLRAGTESVPLIAGFGAAVELLAPTMESRFQYVQSLNTALREKLGALNGVRVLSPEDASPYVMSIIVPKIRSEILLHYLEQGGVYISSGSACAKGASSGIPELFGAAKTEADNVLRISFCADNTMDDVEALVQGIAAGQVEIMHN